MHGLIHVAALAFAVLMLARFMPGVKIKSPATAVLVAVVFSLLNFGLGWLVKAFLVLPVILTFGVFLLFVPFVVNTVMLWATDKLLGDFEIEDLSSLLITSGAITIVNGLFHHLLR